MSLAERMDPVDAADVGPWWCPDCEALVEGVDPEGGFHIEGPGERSGPSHLREETDEEYAGRFDEANEDEPDRDRMHDVICGPVVAAVVHGPYVVDFATGEVLGLSRDEDQREAFRVKDRGSAEWVLERLFEADAGAEAVARRRQMLLDNLDRMAADQRRRREYLVKRFGPELEAWAREEIKTGKSRTVKTPFGSLGFRKRPAKLAVFDEERAIEWAKLSVPEAVKTVDSVLVSMLPSELVKGCIAQSSPPPGFVIEPEADAFRIDTGFARRPK